MWIKFQLKPSILTPNIFIYANDAYWGGGPLAFRDCLLGCCQELHPEIRLLVQPGRDHLSKNVKR